MALSRDARLIARTRRGDAAAFEALHARHQPAILSFCRHLTGNREDAEDAVQHTFLAAYRKIVESDERIELRPWLFTVARNRCVSLLRARREGAVAEADRTAAAVEGLAAEVERRQDLRDLVGDLSRLPEEQRAALVLSQLDALSYREIGGVLGVEPDKVKALVFQARSSLASTREAREAPCSEIRQEIATARGAGLRRRVLRRHVGQCDGCREFEVAMQRQRHQLDVLLPAIPSAGLAHAILGGSLGREGATAGAGAGGAVATAGGAGGGLSGVLAAVGAGGATKLAVVAAVAAGGGVSAAVAADLPERIGAGVPVIGAEREAPSEHAETGRGDGERGGTGSGPAAPEGATGSRPTSERNGDRDERGDHAGGDVGAGRDGDRSSDGAQAGGRNEEIAAAPGVGAEQGEAEGAPRGDGRGLPPGLAKGGDLPPGLAKRGGSAPGLAKRRGGSPGQSGAPSNPGRGHGGSPPGQAGGGSGQGGGQGAGGNGNPNGKGVSGGGNSGGTGGQGNGQGGDGGPGAGGGPGNAGGQGNGNGQADQGQGNQGQGGGAGGQGTGNGGGQSGGGQGNGQGSGGGNRGGGGRPN